MKKKKDIFSPLEKRQMTRLRRTKDLSAQHLAQHMVEHILHLKRALSSPERGSTSAAVKSQPCRPSLNKCEVNAIIKQFWCLSVTMIISLKTVR